MKIKDFLPGRSQRVARQAADWRAEMEEPSSAAQIAAFETWLKADPAHFRAYHDSDRVAKVGARLSVTKPSSDRSAALLRGHRPAYALAATLLVTVGISWLARKPDTAYAAIVNRGQATRVVALRDGSVVILDTATTLEVAVDAAARHVRVLSGRARFAVRRPSKNVLDVTTSAGLATTASGVFDVAVARNDVRVWVISGTARVASTSANQDLAPLIVHSGQGASLRGGVATAMQGERPDPTWPQAHVAFENAPLATILASANRTGLPSISVADDSIGNLRVSGVLDLRDTRRLAHKLAAALNLRVVDQSRGLVLTH